jgi:hypothetical protein
VVDDRRNIAVASQLARRARLPHLKIGEVIRLAFNRVGQCEKESRALGWERRAPATGIKRTSSCSDGGVNVGGRSVWDFADHSASGGVAQGEGASAGCPT